MKNIYATMVAVLLCANGYATDYKKAERTGKFDAFSMIAMQQIEQNADGTASAKSKCAAASKSDNRYTATVQITNGADMAKLASKGFHISTLVSNFGIITTTLDSLQILAEDKDVERISFNEYSMNLDLNKANTVTGVDLVHDGNYSIDNSRSANSLSRAYTGKGVMIGIFDAGFDPNHAMFLDKNGKSRFKMIISKDGSAITDSATIAAYTTDYKYDTHATHVSGIAAGYYKGDNFQIEGVAPEADLAMGPIMSTASDLVALKTLAEYCKARGQRLVTNMSYGTIVGPHDGSDLYSQALNNLIKEYDIVACNSAGNSGNELLVQRHTFTSSTDEMKAIFDLYTSSNQIKSYITTNNASPINMDIIVLTIADRCSTVLGRYPAIVNGEAQSLHLSDSLFNDTYINIAKENIHDGLAGYAINSGINFKDGYYRIAYVITSEEGQKVVVYNDKGCPFNTSFSDYTKELTSNGTVNSSCSASEMLVVGSYITSPSFTSSYDNKTYKLSNSSGTWGTQEGEVTSYSSYGTRYDGTEWPCIVAPGAYVVSAYNRYDTQYSHKKKQTNSGTYNNTEYKFCAMSGTSMASPYMAGIAAIWLEANPNLTHEQIKAIAQQTADVDEYCKEGNHFYEQGKQAGAGKVNALTGLQYILSEMEEAAVDTLVLDENEALPAGCSGTKHVVLKRTFNTTNYNTVVLPFSMDADLIAATFGSDTKVYTFDINSDTQMTFYKTNRIEANKPFLMLTKTADTTFDIDNVEVVEGGEAVDPGLHYDFVGYYGESTYLEAGLYFISGGKLYRSVGKSKIKGYRAYFRPVDTATEAKASVMYVDGEATSITYVGADTQAADSDVLYNINGQEVGKASQQNLPKGVYVTKGKKYIVR